MRPYSQKELVDLHNKNLASLGIGLNNVFHTKCGHSYYVKIGGRKERLIKESNNNRDVGNCSVCWKMGRTPPELRQYASEIINAYVDDKEYEMNNPNGRLEHRSIELEKAFYTWLYAETY
jgi:hypothetical protein